MRLVSILAAAGLLAACSDATSQETGLTVEAPGTLVIQGGPIHTANDDTPMVEAVAVRHDRIIYAGDAEGVQSYIGPDTQMIDLDGAALYPGFTDSHVHVLGVGQREQTHDLSGIQSIAELQAWLEDAATDVDAGGVVFGRGWIETHWPEGRFPNRQDLDAIAPDRQVILVRADGHALVANSAALDAAGITTESTPPEGGDILRDEDGEPAGMLIDTAMGPVYALLGEMTGEQRRDAYAMGANVMASYGWTGAHDMSVPWRDVEMVEALADEGRLPIRAYLSVNPDALATLAEQAPRYGGNGRVITRAVKMYMDGALGSRGAALLEPYSDDHGNTGLILSDEDETLSAMVTALQSGVQLNVHAIGDRGNRMLLDWIEDAQAALPRDEWALADPRWRDEHTQIVDPADIPRFAELGVIPSMQPSHAIGDLFFAPARLGPDRLEGAYAWRALIDSGVVIAGGSDAPVERGDPRIEFYGAVARRGVDGTQTEEWHPDQAVTRQEALRMFTAWPAYASFREDELGQIAVGMRADFTVFSDDIMTIPEVDILTVEPVMTIVDGVVVWEAE
tara:strand:- start:2434 stop:4128 length:1695 start_codon:yes stop_codon:yes gene_type:complete